MCSFDVGCEITLWQTYIIFENVIEITLNCQDTSASGVESQKLGVEMGVM